MTERELRTLVREAIARHAAAAGGAGAAGAGHDAGMTSVLRHHPSHATFAVPAGADTGGPCVIEPAVPCNHCGYCKSYGH